MTTDFLWGLAAGLAVLRGFLFGLTLFCAGGFGFWLGRRKHG